MTYYLTDSCCAKYTILWGVFILLFSIVETGEVRTHSENEVSNTYSMESFILYSNGRLSLEMEPNNCLYIFGRKYRYCLHRVRDNTAGNFTIIRPYKQQGRKRN